MPHPRSPWLVPAALILLALIPALAAMARLGDLATGTPTPATDRFHASPIPVTIHVIASTWFALAGAFQFSPGLRRSRWHRWSGRAVVPMGLAAALSGIWMTLTYPAANADGEAVFIARLVFGAGMTAALGLGVTTILGGNVAAHRAWMLRAYAIGMGAATQVFTHLPWVLLVGAPSEGPRAVLMIGGWLINLALAETLIAKDKRRASPARRKVLTIS